jgi:hypothetical protein
MEVVGPPDEIAVSEGVDSVPTRIQEFDEAEEETTERSGGR